MIAPSPHLTRRSALRAGMGTGLLLAAPTVLRAAPLTKITFQLDWIAYGRHTPYYVALEKGFFAKAGLDVKIEQGTGAMPGFRYLAAGRAQFVFQDIGSMITVRAREGLKIKSVACVYQNAPHTAFYIKGKGIESPKDMEGRKAASSPGSSPKVVFPAFAAVNKIDESKVSWLSADPNSLNALLLNHQTDFMLTYLFTLPVLQKAAQNGDEVGAFTYPQWGLNFYANAILAMDDYIAANPDTVRGFVDAIRQGFAYTLANRQESVEIMKKYQQQLDLESALKEVAILEQLSVTDETRVHGFGVMTETKMRETLDLTAKYIDPGASVPVNDLFTNQFLA
jgi:NitT/TauT family transport system substrate-binding protein